MDIPYNLNNKKYKQMKHLKFLIGILIIMCNISTLNCQNQIVIHFAGNDSIVSTSLADIQRITFNNDNLLLKTVNGIENSYLLDDIVFITFIDEETFIKENTKNIIDVKVYLNAYGEIVVETPCQITGLTIFDLAGKTVTPKKLSSPINVNTINTGIYILKVETTQGIVTKKFIKNR
jgi:hypothetical protein